MLATALWASAASLTRGGTIRHDVPDADYRALAAQTPYAAAGSMNLDGGVCSATLISPYWVLTAAHCVTPEGNALTVNIGGQTVSGLEWFAHPLWNDDVTLGYDVGLVRLAAPITAVSPALLYTGNAEVGAVGTFVGIGRTGTGLTGDTLTHGTERAGQNMLDALASSVRLPSVPYGSSRILVADFDQPGNPAKSSIGSATPLALEYLPAPGDSGGAVFVQDGGQAKLAGVISFRDYGPLANPDGTYNSSYGDFVGATRVSSHAVWIQDQLTSTYWAGGDSGSFHDPARWAGGLVPGAEQVVVFKTGSAFTATLASDTHNKRLRVRLADVTLNLAGHTYTLDTADWYASVEVNRAGGSPAKLTFRNGRVEVVDVLVAHETGTSGQLSIKGTGTVLAASSFLSLGGLPDTGAAAGGWAVMVVDEGAAVNVGGRLYLWGAQMQIANGSVTAGELFMRGSNAAVQGAGTFTLTGLGSWNSGRMSAAGVTRVAAGGHLTVEGLAGGDTPTLSGRTLDNLGTVVWAGDGTFLWQEGARMANRAGAVFDIRNDRPLAQGAGARAVLENDGTLRKSAGAGTNSIAVDVINRGLIEVQTGGLNFARGITGEGDIALEAGTSLTAAHLRQGTVSLQPGTALNLRASGSAANVSRLEALELSTDGDQWFGRLDLADNDLVLAGGSDPAAVLARLASQIAQAHNPQTGRWDGAAGVTSSAAAARADGLMALGFLHNDAGGVPIVSSFNGLAVGVGDILVKYTPVGDADLNGVVNADDFTLLLAGLSGAVGTSATWYYGDFDYNGVVNADDVTLWSVGLANPGTAPALGPVSVPEPASALLLLGAAGLLLRRRHRGSAW